MSFIRFFAVGICVLFTFRPALVHADILITPTSVVFEDRDRFSFVTLVNVSDQQKSYEISWLHYMMSEGTGSYVAKEQAKGDFDLAEHLVYSPRRVTLAPGGKQRVRLALRRPESIDPGDYHVHMKFRVLPDDELPLLPGDNGQKDSKAQATVNINVSYTIPVTLRVGEPDYQAEIGQISVGRDEKGALEVSVPVEREGLYAVLGWLQVYNVTPDGREEMVGEISNANIFSEINKRVFSVPLKKEVSEGSLKIVMRYKDPDRDIVYAERIFPLQ